MKLKIAIPIIVAVMTIIPTLMILGDTEYSDADVTNTTLSLSYYVGDEDLSTHMVKSVTGQGSSQSGSCSLISGSVPTGMSFSDSSNGGRNSGGYWYYSQFKLNGNPTTQGTYTFTVRATISGSSTDCVVTATVSAAPGPIYFTVQYDANSGTVSPSSETVESGSQITLATPTRQNYSFDGWYTDRTGGTRVGGAGDSYTVTGSLVLYAHWTYVPPTYTYTLNFNANGGTGAPATMTYGPTTEDYHTFTIPDTEPTYTGYVFIGWSLSQQTPGSGTAQYHAGDTLRNSASLRERTLYAVWGPTYTYTLNFNANGGTGAPATMTYGPTTEDYHTFTIPDTEPTYTGYVFIGWSLSQQTPGSGTAQYHAGDTLRNSVSLRERTLYAVWESAPYTVTFNANGGTVSPATKTVYYMKQYGDLPVPSLTGYEFNGWYTDQTNGDLINGSSIYSLTTDQTLYAHWTEAVTYWSNGNPNGSVSILYHIDNPNVENDIVTKYSLYKYNQAITDDPNTELNESFTQTGYYILVEVNSVRLGSTNDIKVIAGLYDSSNNLIVSDIYDFGTWGSFIITVDTVNATVGYTKVMQFRTFSDYQESITGTILSYGSQGDFSNQVTQSLRITPVTDTVPRQQVVKTSVFLNTYGVVLRDPSLDIGTYFPEMEKMRLNFYSFALLGNSVTINGHTMNVTAPNITVYYTSDVNGKYIQDGPGDNVTEKSLELTNIFVTWDGEKCYLTFANENLTIDMGTYTDKTVSFSGMWYFASALYEPYTAQETSYEVDWWGSFNLSTFGIVFAGLLIVGALLCKATIGGRTLDYVIVICASIVALIIAGGLVNA